MAHAFLAVLGSVQVIQRCTKVAFPSRREATQAARGMARQTLNPVGLVQRGYGRLQAYRCGVCAGWHVGHKPMKGRV